MSDIRNILFIVVDCLRADRCWGNGRTVQTPHIDRLVHNSTICTQAISTTSYTVSSFATILTGMLPFQHGLRGVGGKTKLNDEVYTLAQALKEGGYKTYAEVTGPLIPLLGLNKGFDTYTYRNVEDTLYEKWGIEFMQRLNKGDYRPPWFIFLHLWEIHDPPRIIGRKYRYKKYGINRYDRALSSLDEKIGQIITHVDDQTIVVLTGDHGEGISSDRMDTTIKWSNQLIGKMRWLNESKRFAAIKKMIKSSIIKRHADTNTVGQSGKYEYPHGMSLDDYNHRVPIILHGAGLFEEGRQIERQVCHTDLYHTLLDTIGLDKCRNPNGRHIDFINQPTPDEKDWVYLELAGDHIPESEWIRGIRTQEFKYLRYTDRESEQNALYDLKRDPKELNNIIGEKQDLAEFLSAKLDEILTNNDSLVKDSAKLSSEEKEKIAEKLQELGYL